MAETEMEKLTRRVFTLEQIVLRFASEDEAKRKALDKIVALDSRLKALEEGR
jgi:hypothetical protein